MDGQKKWSFRITPFRLLLIGIAGVGILLTLARLYTGLGAVTNLNDRWAWGLWIILDLTAVALAGAGYSLCVLTHVFHIEKFKPLARRGLLISLVGYIFVLMTLIVEIGRWDNFWQPYVHWGHESPLFEVFMAITAYMLLQMIELSEVITEKIGQKLHKLIKAVLPVVFILAAIIPFGHQASLGAIYLIVPDKLHPLWYSANLPWFFLMTSFFVGPAMVALEYLWSTKAYKLKQDLGMLKGLARITGGLMLVYFVWKVADLAVSGSFGYIFSGTLEGNMFLLELVVGLLIPIIISFTPMIATRAGVGVFSFLTVLGLIINRVNVTYVGMRAALGPGYAPSFIEWGMSLGLLAIVMLMYIFIIENFAIYDKAHAQEEAVAYQGKHKVGFSTAK